MRSSWLALLIIGLLAGWIAGKLTKGHGFGFAGNLVIGVLGAVLGGLVFSLLGVTAFSFIGQLVMAVIGAVVLLYLLKVAANR